jgi:hypothetical protein
MRRQLVPVLALVLLQAACSGSRAPDDRRAAPPADPQAERDAAVERLAVDLMKRAASHEPETSRVLKEVARRAGGALVGFQHRLKRRASLLRKIRSKLAADAALDVGQVVIDDALRYTLQVRDEPPGAHADAIRTAFGELERAGHRVQRVKNYWPRGDNYSGVNSVLVAPDGLLWELQFHTPESFRLKQETHDLYEEMREDSTPLARKRELYDELAAPWEQVDIPAGLLDKGALHPSDEVILNPPP